MSNAGRVRLAVAAGAAVILLSHAVYSQHNSYQTIDNYFKLPEGRKIGSTAGITIDRDGTIGDPQVESSSGNPLFDRAAIRALLVSPGFLFRVDREPSGVAPGSNYRISDIDLASRPRSGAPSPTGSRFVPWMYGRTRWK